MGKLKAKLLCFNKLWLTCALPPACVCPQSPTTWRRMKSRTRWTSCEDPRPASPPCCLKYAASGPWSTCQKSWSNLTRQEDTATASNLHNSWQTDCPPQIGLRNNTPHMFPLLTLSSQLTQRQKDRAGKRLNSVEKVLQQIKNKTHNLFK